PGRLRACALVVSQDAVDCRVWPLQMLCHFDRAHYRFNATTHTRRVFSEMRRNGCKSLIDLHANRNFGPLLCFVAKHNVTDAGRTWGQGRPLYTSLACPNLVPVTLRRNRNVDLSATL